MRQSMIYAMILSAIAITPASAATSTPLANEPGAAPAVRGTGHGNAADPMMPETNSAKSNNAGSQWNRNCAGNTTSPNMLASRWGRNC
jgi:hypothetical protein